MKKKTITINNNLDKLTQSILEVVNSKKRNIILIGGLSRSGKSYIAKEVSNELNNKGYQNIIINLDWWLISVDERKPDSNVLDRYEVDKIEHSIIHLIQGKTVFHPVYDQIKRRRIKEKCDEFIQIKKEIIIIEGIIALAIPNLLKMACLKIYVDISEELRLKRLSEFYLEYKKITVHEFDKLLNDRNLEEVPFIKKKKDNANVVFYNK